MARCDRCSAPHSMFNFSSCENCGLPCGMIWNKINHKAYPDIRNPDQILIDHEARIDELSLYEAEAYNAYRKQVLQSIDAGD